MDNSARLEFSNEVNFLTYFFDISLSYSNENRKREKVNGGESTRTIIPIFQIMTMIG